MDLGSRAQKTDPGSGFETLVESDRYFREEVVGSMLVGNGGEYGTVPYGRYRFTLNKAFRLRVNSIPSNHVMSS